MSAAAHERQETIEVHSHAPVPKFGEVIVLKADLASHESNDRSMNLVKIVRRERVTHCVR
jgi:hypothetical protein